MLFPRQRVSDVQDEQVPEICFTTMCIDFTLELNLECDFQPRAHRLLECHNFFKDGTNPHAIWSLNKPK